MQNKYYVLIIYLTLLRIEVFPKVFSFLSRILSRVAILLLHPIVR